MGLRLFLYAIGVDDPTEQALERVRQEIAHRGLRLAEPLAEAAGARLQTESKRNRPIGPWTSAQIGAPITTPRLWLRAALAALGLLAVLPWLAPLFAAAGWWGLADPIYTLYMFLCHQLPERAAFLFGYQVAFCWRNSAIYAGLFGFGLLYALSTRAKRHTAGFGSRVRSDRVAEPLSRLVTLPAVIPLWAYLLTLLPLALDGFSHMLGVRDGLFNDPSFGSFLVGSQFLSLNWWLRISTGLLAAFATVWFTFPRVIAYMSLEKANGVATGTFMGTTGSIALAHVSSEVEPMSGQYLDAGPGQPR